jgi:hypothetical protein
LSNAGYGATVFWIETPCSLREPDVSEEHISILSVEEYAKQPAETGHNLGLVFGPEDGGDMFLRNVWVTFTAV